LAWSFLSYGRVAVFLPERGFGVPFFFPLKVFSPDSRWFLIANVFRFVSYFFLFSFLPSKNPKLPLLPFAHAPNISSLAEACALFSKIPSPSLFCTSTTTVF